MPTKKGTIRERKIFCFNKEDNSVSIYSEEKIPLRECPEDIVSDFINDIYSVSIIITKKEPK